MAVIHPDLRAIRLLPRFSIGPRLSGLARRAKERPRGPWPGVATRTMDVPGPPGGHAVTLRVLSPARPTGPVPALVWVHGGGHVLGSPYQDDEANAAFVQELGIAVIAVRYRLGAQAPAPAAVDDVYAGLLGVTDRADELGIDRARIAIGGASAGGGIAAAVASKAHDLGAVRPVFQLLVYPMLDDRTVSRDDRDTSQVRVWTPKSNRYGWHSYLGVEPGSPSVPDYAVPARRSDLSGLPPAWIGVGSLDLFHEEDVEYARRLNEAGVRCAVDVVPGAFHGFDALFAKTPVARAFWQSQADALGQALLRADRPTRTCGTAARPHDEKAERQA